MSERDDYEVVYEAIGNGQMDFEQRVRARKALNRISGIEPKGDFATMRVEPGKETVIKHVTSEGVDVRPVRAQPADQAALDVVGALVDAAREMLANLITNRADILDRRLDEMQRRMVAHANNIADEHNQRLDSFRPEVQRGR